MKARKRKLRSDAGTARKDKYKRRIIRRQPMNYRCRCANRACAKRQTIRKHPSHYREWPTCGACGTILKIDWYRQTEETRRSKCECGAVHFPHNKNICAKVRE